MSATLPSHSVAGSSPAELNLPRSHDSGIAPTVGHGSRLLQQMLFLVGAILLPVGVVTIILGAYGAARTAFLYDQMTYVISGGLLGLGLTFCGGFLYFGAWLARIAEDGREAARQAAEDNRRSSEQVASTLLALTAAVQSGTGMAEQSRLVVAGSGRTVHRADCQLLAGRTDLRAADAESGDATPCRICLIPGA